MSTSPNASPTPSAAAHNGVKPDISGLAATNDNTIPSSPPSVKLFKLLHLPEEDEVDVSPNSTAPGSPELPASLLFEEVGEPAWSLSAYVLEEKIASLKLNGESEELDALPGLECLGLTW
ncbi:hypothetical protein PsYK624_135300 [Phanerochaete sordida]|uniref:Uncharacterized protein n=1 Tax=Phanerochaete sordida TaxID=48140 RepID=A0A9P3LK36_9APHY|nr:hypothetical protein PsYK624_135300 [Phanerochaete sordida]